jgi:hypothetical protein
MSACTKMTSKQTYLLATAKADARMKGIKIALATCTWCLCHSRACTLTSVCCRGGSGGVLGTRRQDTDHTGLLINKKNGAPYGNLNAGSQGKKEESLKMASGKPTHGSNLHLVSIEGVADELVDANAAQDGQQKHPQAR